MPENQIVILDMPNLYENINFCSLKNPVDDFFFFKACSLPHAKHTIFVAL